MKSKVVLALLVVIALSSVSSIWLASAQQARTSRTVELAHVSVQLSYPSTAQPGNPIILNALATAKEDVVMDELVVQLYLPSQSGLELVGSATIAKSVAMKTGSQVSTDINIAIPSGAHRSSLMAVIKENARVLTSEYWYRCTSGVCYWEPNYTYPGGQYIPQVPEGFGSHDVSFAPLTYVDGISQASSSADQMSTTLKLDYVNVQLTYPSILMPGQTATLNVKAISHDDFEMDSLDVHIFVPVQNDIKQIASGNIVRGVIMTGGSQVSKDVTFTAPSDAPADALLAVVMEDVRFPPWANSYGYGYAMTVDQNSTYPYNYRISPVAGVTNPNVIGYTSISYVNANVQTTSAQSMVSPTQTQPLQQNPTNLTTNQPNPQSQPPANADDVQLLAAIVVVAALVSALAFLFLRRRTHRKPMQSNIS